MLDDKEFLMSMAKKAGMEFVDLEGMKIDPSVIRYLPVHVAKKYNLIPISIFNGKLVIAIEDPLDTAAIQDAELFSRLKVVSKLAGGNAIREKINEYYSKAEKTEQTIKELSSVEQAEEVTRLDSSALEISNAPIVRLVNSIFSDAVSMGASDIHIEPFERIIRVRLRVDGELRELSEIPINLQSSIVSRIKIISNLNIAETMRPQDGRVKTQINNVTVNMRISVIPTIFGEKIVVRLLNASANLMDKSELGMSPENMERLERLLHISEGIVLLTGPTGSGKTTTLYSVLKDFNVMGKNLITLEDPVEYQVYGINQVQVNTQAGMTFASGLRSILRQDPDIVMLGEIRDEETAQIAIRAAVTGHVVLSTLHTNDTVSSISRLVDMNIPRYMVSSAVAGIIAQRLVKRICQDCKEEYEATEEEKEALNMTGSVTLCRGRGCPKCNKSGYKGRIAVHEILVLDSFLKAKINAGSTDDVIQKEARERGMILLGESAKTLVLQGITTVPEMNRATYSL